MDAITKDPLWLGAQVPFVELSDKFRADPLALPQQIGDYFTSPLQRKTT
jgi:hypothetical protein